MKSSSATSSRGNEESNHSPQQHQPELSAPDPHNDRHQIEKLKSPRPEKSFRADWQVLIDEALGDEIGAYDDDDADGEAEIYEPK